MNEFMRHHLHHFPRGENPIPDRMNRPIPQLLITITDADYKERIAELCKGANARVFQCRGKGTATSEMMDIFGLADTDKVVTICLVTKQLVFQLMKKLKDALRINRAGGGIAFTLPCSGIAGPALRLLEEEIHKQFLDHIESEVNLVKENATHDLIVAVINQGFSEELIEHAKEAGATGGTLIHASHIMDAEKAKSWGITVHDEKEIVIMLVHREQKVPIMKAIGKVCGITTKAHGLILSLPVDEVEGLSEAL